MKNPYLSLISSVWFYGSKWKVAIISYYVAYIIAQTSLSISPYAFGRTIDILQNFQPNKLPEVILWLSIGIAVILLFWLFHAPARTLEKKVALKIEQEFRLSFYKQLTQLPLIWHKDHHSGNIMTRLKCASAALSQFAENQFSYIEIIIKFIMSIGFLLWISVPVGVINLLISISLYKIVILFDRKLIPLYKEQNAIESHVGEGFFDYISNITTILTLQLGKLTYANLAKRMQAIWPFFIKDVVLNETKWFITGLLLTTIQSVILITYIIYKLQYTDFITIGTVVMIFRYQYDVGMAFQGLSSRYSKLVRMDTDIKEIQPLLNDVKKLAYSSQTKIINEQWGVLEITGLSFKYVDASKEMEIIKCIDLKIKKGEKIALIGESGSGKSTLMNLLCGIYTAPTVRLTIDGVPFGSLDSLKTITTLIPQDPEIFENTIAFNITFDLPTNEDDIYLAVELAGFQPILDTFSAGLATDIREKGLNLSVGQKQRLALARGLFAARFSSLILMDEPTSSVDLPTEKKIITGIINEFPQKTIIASLHRLHLLLEFDSVIMLQHGKIMAYGPTSELLKKPGLVRDLWRTYSGKI